MSHGGKRQRAGRPPVDPLYKKINTGYKLSQWVVDKLRELDEPAGPALERAIIKERGWKAP